MSKSSVTQRSWPLRVTRIFFRLLLLGLLGGAVWLLISWAVWPYSAPAWTGFAPFNERTGGPLARTLWDWMELLIVPLFVALSVWWFGRSERASERELARQSEALRRTIATNRQNQTTLETVFTLIGNLLLSHDLKSAQNRAEERSIARAHTLAALTGLDAERKATLVQFLYESGLIQAHNPIIDLAGADLRKADFRHKTLTGICLRKALMNGADFANSILESADLESALLNEANFREAELTGANFVSAHLEDARLVGANVTAADFRNAHLEGADMYRLRGYRAHFGRASLAGACLEGAIMREADFQNAYLREARFSSPTKDRDRLFRAVLEGANFRGANMEDADLSFADLSRANLGNTLLRNTKFVGANLRDANLEFAVVSDGLIELTSCLSLHQARTPDYKRHDATVDLDILQRSDIENALSRVDRKLIIAAEVHGLSGTWDIVWRGGNIPVYLVLREAGSRDKTLPHDIYDEAVAFDRLKSWGFVLSEGGTKAK